MTGEQPAGKGDDPKDHGNRLARSVIARLGAERLGELERIARRLLRRHRVRSVWWDPEDIVQETVLALCQGAEAGSVRDLPTDAELHRYVHSVLIHQVVRAVKHDGAVKRGGSHQRVELDLDGRPSPQLTHEEAAELRDVLECSVNQEPGDRLLREVYLQIAEGRTNAEIAESLGISPRTVERKREVLRAALQRLGFSR